MGRRWYCGICRARYKTKYGVLVEIILNGKAMYCKADLPPHAIQDAKLMKIEEDFKEYSTPEALLAALPRVSPLDRKVFLVDTAVVGHYKIDETMLSGVAKLEWNQLYNLAREPGKKPPADMDHDLMSIAPPYLGV